MTTVATCPELARAQLLKSALEGNGIEAFIPDELTAQNAPPYLWASGGIRVQVADEQAEAAREIIARLEAPAAESDDTDDAS